MHDYSDLIVEVMKYVDEKIERINPQSVDRNRLQSRIRTQIVANIKRIAVLEQINLHREIDKIINTQLLEEISRNLKESNLL